MPRFVRAVRTLLVGLALLSTPLLATTAAAQVGHLPSRSPYQDLKPSQEITLLGGHFGSDAGLAGILPKASFFGGLRYDLPLGGPGFLTARYIFMPSERAYLLPTNAESSRILGTTNTTTHEADIGFSVALTGRKTWHHLVPSFSAGAGLASSFAEADTGGYKFGTKFSFNYGLNFRYALRNGYGIRAEATNFIWQNRYPDSYLIPAASDSTSVIASADQRTDWAGHWALSLGFIIPIFR
jgi:hypothetical protein